MEYKNYEVDIFGLVTGMETTATSKEHAISQVVHRACSVKNRFKYGRFGVCKSNRKLILDEVLRIYRSGSTFVTVKESALQS